MRRGRGNRIVILVVFLVVLILLVVAFFVLTGNSNTTLAPTVQPTFGQGTQAPQPADATPSATPVTAKIVIASKDIPLGTALSASNVTLADVPSAEAQAPNVVLGKDAVSLYGKLTTVRYFKGQRLHTTDVIDGPFSNLMAQLVRDNRLEPGKKAFAFAADDMTGVGQLISEGDLIDVVASFEVSVPPAPPYALNFFGTPLVIIPTAQPPQTATKTILQNVRVLKVIPLAAPFNGLGQPAEDTPTPVAATPSTANAPTPVPANGGTPATVASSFYEANGQGFPITVIYILGVTDQEAEVLKFTREQIRFTGPSSSTNGTAVQAIPLAPAIIHFTLRARPGRANDLNDPALLREETRGATFRIMITNYAVPVPEIVQVR